MCLSSQSSSVVIPFKGQTSSVPNPEIPRISCWITMLPLISWLARLKGMIFRDCLRHRLICRQKSCRTDVLQRSWYTRWLDQRTWLWLPYLQMVNYLSVNNSMTITQEHLGLTKRASLSISSITSWRSMVKNNSRSPKQSDFPAKIRTTPKSSFGMPSKKVRK